MRRRAGERRGATWYQSSSSRPTRQLAFTLPEILVVLAMMSVLLGLAAARISAAADQAAVRGAAQEAAALFTSARDAAIYRRAAVAVLIDTLRGSIETRADSVLLVRRDLRSSFGVRLTTSRDSMAYDPLGMGVGAANLSLIARRGRAVDTVFVSRLGRVRY